MSQPPHEDLDETLPPPDEGELEDGAEHRRFVLKRELSNRLDAYLKMRIKGATRNQVQKLIKAGGVTVNDKETKASQKLKPGDVIDVILPPPPLHTLEPQPIPLDVLYEDPYFIVLNKQADLIIHPARSHRDGTLLNALAHHFLHEHGITDAAGELSTVGSEDARPGVVHRLDKHTTGAIVVAKEDEAHWKIARQFEQRKTLKAYLALVHGNFEQVGDVIDQPIGKHPTIREAYSVRHDSRAKESVTICRVREQYEGYSLVELELKTGRTHQIRVHLTWLGHPIVGDIVYGGQPIGETEIEHPPEAAGSRRFTAFARTKPDGEAIEAAALQRDDLWLTHPALHAARLQFEHPILKKTVNFQAPLREPMATIIRRLRDRRIDAPVANPDGCWVDLDSVLPP